jgi:hypothetical protein
MRINSSGNVGIGTTSPSYPLHVSGKIYSTGVVSSAGNSFELSDNNVALKRATNDMTLNTGGSERMRINAQGRITQNGSSVIGGAFYSHTWNSVSGPQMGLNSTDASGNAHNYFIFQREGTQRGSISVSGSATAYNTSSDYRMKENVNYTWDATARLKQLKPARFNFISDDTNTLVDGFIAHEVSSIVPEAISGAKDAMAVETRYTADDVETQGDTPSKNVGDSKTYSSTKIDPQGIDQSKLVPLLVKTIQELEARITALEA